MTDNPKPNPPPSPGEIALMQIGSMGVGIPAQMQELLTALNMRKVMEGVIADAVGGRGYHSAPSSPLAEPSRPAPTVKSTNGWADEVKIQSPPGMDHIERLANAFQPHGPLSPLRKPKEEPTK